MFNGHQLLTFFILLLWQYLQIYQLVLHFALIIGCFPKWRGWDHCQSSIKFDTLLIKQNFNKMDTFNNSYLFLTFANPLWNKNGGVGRVYFFRVLTYLSCRGLNSYCWIHKLMRYQLSRVAADTGESNLLAKCAKFLTKNFEKQLNSNFWIIFHVKIGPWGDPV